MRLLLLITAFFMFTSCQNNQVENSVTSQDTTQKYSHHDLGTLSIDLPPTWQRIPNDFLPQTIDMTARYWIRTGKGDTVFLIHGFSAWDLSADDGSHYIRKRDSLFGKTATKFTSKDVENRSTGIFVDSVGEVKPVGYYGFVAYTKGPLDSSVDSFWNVIRTIRLHPFK